MKHNLLKIFTLIAVSTIMLSCHRGATKSVEAVTGASIQQEVPIAPPKPDVVGVASPRVFIYKTRADYSNLVPVMLNDAKTMIESYPDPLDVRHKPVPTQLRDGWLLDNRGIGRNVAFTSYTYDEYAALTTAPSTDELMQRIVDKNPLTEAYICAPRHTYGDSLVEQLNDIVASGFAGCRRVTLSAQ